MDESEKMSLGLLFVVKRTRRRIIFFSFFSVFVLYFCVSKEVCMVDVINECC